MSRSSMPPKCSRQEESSGGRRRRWMEPESGVSGGRKKATRVKGKYTFPFDEDLTKLTLLL